MVTFCSTPENWKLLTKNLRTKHRALYEKHWPREFFVKEQQVELLEQADRQQRLLISELEERRQALEARILALEFGGPPKGR